MNLFYEEYPCSIWIEGEAIPILTDFRSYIKLMDVFRAKDLTDRDRAEFICSFFLKIPSNMNMAIESLLEFISMDTLKPPVSTEVLEDVDANLEEEPVKMVYSFEFDYPYILAGFRQCYQIDLRTVEYMHWWEFRCLFQGLPVDTEIKQRIHYRGLELSEIKDKEERKRVQRIQNEIRLPGEELSDYDIGNAFM